MKMNLNKFKSLAFRRVSMNQEVSGDGAGQQETAKETSAVQTPPVSAPPAAADFFSALDAEHRESLEKQGIKDVNGLVKNWADQRSYIGNSIRVPSAEAGREDWGKFYEKLQKHAPNLIPRPDREKPETMEAVMAALGRPEKPDQYEMPEAPEGIALADDRVEALRKIAHEKGLSKDQFQGMLSEVFKLDSAQYQQQKQTQEADAATLKQQWGSAYDQNKNEVVRLMELTNAPSGIVQMAKDGGMGADVYQWFHSLSGNFKGEGTNATVDQGGNRAMTPDEANNQISEIYANKSHPFFVASHPEHKQALDKMVKLMKFANPQASSNPNDLRTSRDAKFGD
jgi:hypothetical protein